MNETPNIAIELLKIITGFLSDNLIPIIVLVLLIISRDAIGNFISRLTSFSWRNGDTELGMSAVDPNQGDEKKAEYSNALQKPEVPDEDAEVEGITKEENWLKLMVKAFEEERLEDADEIFREYALSEKDEVKLEEHKAIYFYLRFEMGKDNSAINDLENLVRTAKTEETKYKNLEWLSLLLKDSMQNKKEIDIWLNVIPKFKSQNLVTKSTVNLAYALNREDQPKKAKKLLIERLSDVEEAKQKSAIFKALSEIEDSLDHKTISVYCKDKSIEYNPNDRDELFNSAYLADNQGVDEISISNYIKLIRIDSNNSFALNNLGVRAKKAGLTIKAIENYKKAANYNNTLAMANQGYMLLDAGFTDEAEEIAKKALELDEPHQNVYSLISAINEKKEKQNTDWNELSKKALNRQKSVRCYTEQYYVGIPSELAGNWFAKDNIQFSIEIRDNAFESTWQEFSSFDKSTYTVMMTGKVTGSTFSGQYSRKEDEGGNSAKGLLKLIENTNKKCIGYLDNEGKQLKLISQEFKDDFSLSFSRSQA